MQFAIFGSAQADSERPGAALGEGFHAFVEFNVEAEALGYCASFLVEHHLTGWNQVSATLQPLTCLAARTTTLRLGTAVLVLTWHNPVLLAEQALTLDLISGGRLDFGIGKGYRHTEFEGFCMPPEEAQARFGPRTPTRATRPADASVDPTDARQAVARVGPTSGQGRRPCMILRAPVRHTEVNRSDTPRSSRRSD
jgi:alkanesulfonate monooxygenase SsuD/methylene tetrahydromethanopterin reductase-like flavin-dependent oxidoreductase (luciferase family)